VKPDAEAVFRNNAADSAVAIPQKRIFVFLARPNEETSMFLRWLNSYQGSTGAQRWRWTARSAEFTT
jgi:hypothetical protein